MVHFVFEIGFMVWKSLMKVRKVVGIVLMDTIEEDGSLSPTISLVLQTSLPVSKVSVLCFLYPVDLVLN